MYVENSPDNKDICRQFCGTCPSYLDCGARLLFCSRGNLQGTVAKKGCKCGMCPVSVRHNLDGAYYCIHGNLDTLID